MIRSAIAGAAALVCVFAPQTGQAASQADAPSLRNTPLLTMQLNPPSGGDTALVWESGAVVCDSGVVEPAAWVAPHPLLLPKKSQTFPVTIGFAIDGTGRATSITALEGGYVSGTLDMAFNREQNALRVSADNILRSLTTRDLMPSLRASRFEADAPQTGCQITYTPQSADAADLPRALLARLGVVPRVRLSPALRDQLGGGDCNTVGWPQPLQRVFPDWRKISAREGARKWSWIAFDINDSGKPVNVTLLASSGHDDLDAEALRAARQSRFAEGKRTGCTVEYWRNPGVVPAPPKPDKSEFAGYQDCALPDRWATPPRLTFPPPYAERNIDGWAVLGFDVDAEGQIGNITVLSAQPSEEFGTAATAVLRSARAEAGTGPRERCVERVIFTRDQPDEKATADS